jgi:hypothetical protein
MERVPTVPHGWAVSTGLRSRFILLQSLISIVLSYQVLSAEEVILSTETQLFIILGLLMIVGGLMLLPPRYVEAPWFPSALVSLDTLTTTLVIYFSGNARPDLYLTYFLIVLIAASATSLRQMIALSVVLCAGYLAVLYIGIMETGLSSVGDLLGLPILLVMAVFYGVAAHALGRTPADGRPIPMQLDAMRQQTMTLQATHDDLQAKVATLKAEFARLTHELERVKQAKNKVG